MDFINRLQDQLTVPAATALMVASAAIIHNYQVPANITGVSALSTIIANKLFDIKEYIVAHIQNPETIPDTLGVALGKLFMVDIAATKDEQINGTPKTTPALSGLNRLEKLTNPPTRTAVIAWVIFLLSAQYIHELNEADRYQNRFLIVGVVLALNASIVAYIIDETNLFMFKTFIPASVVAALVLSAASHRYVIPKEVAKEKKEQ